MRVSDLKYRYDYTIGGDSRLSVELKKVLIESAVKEKIGRMVNPRPDPSPQSSIAPRYSRSLETIAKKVANDGVKLAMLIEQELKDMDLEQLALEVESKDKS